MENTNSSESHQHQVMASLEAIHRSPGFAASPQMYSFLRYIVLQKLDGKEDRLKAYSIALDALGRSKSFDPQADPIVRVIAGRLRAALSMYYAENEFSDPIRIEIPKGSYRPVFINQSQPAAKKGLGWFNWRFLSQLSQLRSSVFAVLVTSFLFLTAFQLDKASSISEAKLDLITYTPIVTAGSNCASAPNTLNQLAWR